MIRCEIHCHTRASDGYLFPEQLVELAVEKEVEVLGITDHDTVGGVAKALLAAEGTGVEVWPGIEISSRHGEHSVHVLGYLFDHQDPVFLSHLKELKKARVDRMHAMVDRLQDLGVGLETEEVERLAKGGVVGRPHVARAMLYKGVVGSMGEAFDEYLGNNKPAFVPRTDLSAEEAVAMIHAAGGVAVFAHPGLIRDEAVWHDILEQGFDGVEVYHPSHTRTVRKKLKKIARDRRLIPTGGTDFHGKKRRRSPGRNEFGSTRLAPEVLSAIRGLSKHYG